MDTNGRLRSTSRIAGACAAAALLLSGCGGGDEAEGGNTAVKMGYVPWIGYGGWFIADEEGYFEENGVDVDLTAFNSDADKNNALMAGQIDVLNIASHGALQLLENDSDLTVVLLMDMSTTADAIAAGEGVSSVTDLAGKQVAYEEITTSDILLNYALIDNGMSLDDIEPVPMAASAAGSALLGGQVDAAVTYEPYLSEAQSADDSVEILYTAGEAPGLISDVLLVRNDFLEESPEAIQGLVDSWGQGMEFFEADESRAKEIIAEGVGADIDSLGTAFDGVEFYDLEDNRTQLTGEFAETVLPMVQEASVDAGVLGGPVEFSDALDPSFVEAAP